MSSAKVIIKEQDRSVTIPSMSGSYGGIVVATSKGPINEPFLVTKVDEFISVYGEPVLKYGVSAHSALTYLGSSNKLWAVRAAHDDITYAGVLVRSKVLDLPQGVVSSDYQVDPIVKPIGGLTQEQVDSFTFPTYVTNRLFAELDNTIKNPSFESYEVQVNILDGFEVGDKISFDTEALSVLNDQSDYGDSLPFYSVTETLTKTLAYDKIKLEAAQDVLEGEEIFKADGTSYPNSPKVMRTANATAEVLVDNADYLTPGEGILFSNGDSVFLEKNLYEEEAHFVKIDNLVSLTTDKKIFKIVQSKFEDRDAFLVTAANQGKWGNELSIAIAPNSDYDDIGGFNLVVYHKGVLVENWVVTRDDQIDGFGFQLNMEQKINNGSAYIKVHNNDFDVDAEDKPQMPLATNYALWRRDPEDIFLATANSLIENLIVGHSEVKLSSITDLEMGTRIKFLIGDDGELSAEYKVESTNPVTKVITLDRPIIEDEIGKIFHDSDGAEVTSLVYRFDDTYNVSAEGIVDGIQNYTIDKLDKVFYNYPMNSVFDISGMNGKLLDAGANLMLGGSEGSAITVYDLITASQKLMNKDDTPVTLLMDGGYAIPAYAQALVQVAQAQNLTHVYLSCDPTAEMAFNYKKAIVDYKAATMLNTEKASLFTGWIKIADSYNQKDVWVSPEAFAAASQEYTTKNYQIWYPAAGWTRGKLLGLDVRVKFSEGDLDWLVDNRINPIKYKKGSGLVIWGNETTLVKPSPMQLRSVAMLLIAIKYSVGAMLEYIPFELGNERTYSLVEGAIKAYMRDEIKGKGGVYDAKVAILDVITDSDQDNRRMPVYIGIQPTMDIKEIPVTLAIYNKSVDIDVSL